MSIRDVRLTPEDAAAPLRLSEVLTRFMADARSALSKQSREQWQELRVTVPSPYIAPTYAANWAPWGDANYHDARYYGDALGRVHLDGLAKNLNAASTVVFTLPVGYRPSKGLIYSVWSSAGAKEVRVEADGRVAFASPTLDGWHSLAGISFAPAVLAPPAASCWPIDFACDFDATPRGVSLVEVYEIDAQNARASANVASLGVDWQFLAKAGKPHIRVRSIPGLPAGKSYRVRLKVEE